jgi:hypothetical protein
MPTMSLPRLHPGIRRTSQRPPGQTGCARRGLLHGASTAVAVVFFVSGSLRALQAAGLNVAEPVGGGAIKTLIDTLQSNWEWLIVTGVSLALAIVAGLVIFGSQRAPEHVFRIVGGIVMLVVVIPAVLH